MGLWKPPEKILLPSEHDDAPSLFEYNGHLPDGTQILAYLFTPPDGELPADASGEPGYRYLAAIHEFDADGHHRLARTAILTGRCRDPMAVGPAAHEQLREMVAPYRAAGWRPGDIRVRPFLVRLNGYSHGLVYEADGDGLEGDVCEEEGCECGEEREGAVFFYPFWFPFRPPYDSGSYDT